MAVVYPKTMMVIAHYDLAFKGGTCAGLARRFPAAEQETARWCLIRFRLS
jgi:hypothetical protein